MRQPSPVQGPSEAARFEALAMPHASAAYNLAYRLSRRPDVAEDIVHDAYVRALAAFAGFRGGDGRAWILTIVRNRFYDWRREQKLKGTVSLTALGSGEDDDDADWDVADPDQDTLEEELLRKTDALNLRHLIDRLSPKLREVLVLREMEDLSYRQIAEITQCPIGSVMSRLSRARALLGEAWRAQGAAIAPEVGP
jgi:RNA polymerase sigma factor (sigma-70 family)